MVRKLKDSGPPTSRLLEIASRLKLKTREEILEHDILEEALRSTRGYLQSGEGKKEVQYAVVSFKKLCSNKKSLAYRRIAECKEYLLI
jgi:hypothetical protein